MNKQLTLAIVAGTLFLAQTVSADSNWNSFRGPTGRGHATAKDVPVKWDASKIAWKLKLKGKGQSSAVNAGDKLFLTGASSDGTERYVFCVDKNKGKLLWDKTIKSPTGRTHNMNSYATPTCVTDGERVVAFFGPGGIQSQSKRKKRS